MPAQCSRLLEPGQCELAVQRWVPVLLAEALLHHDGPAQVFSLPYSLQVAHSSEV